MNTDLLKDYVNAAEMHGIGTLEGDFKKANSAYEKIKNIYLELKGSNNLESLIPLLTHSSIKVRSWAATHLLPIDEKGSVRVLEEIAQEKSPFGLGAKMVIKEWKAGKLKY